MHGQNPRPDAQAHCRSRLLPQWFSGASLVRRDRLRELKQRAGSWHDLELIKSIAPQKRSRCVDLLEQSRSQLRQDIFALSELDFATGGFFVEFGATNGVDLSNSHLMETEFGWRGILAEPGRGWHQALRKNRSATIDTRCVWKETGATVSFTQTPSGLTSGISSFVKPSRRMRGNSYQVETVSLNDLLQQHAAPPVIDYISIDTEGSEFDILGMVDFDRWSFRVLTIEHAFLPQREDIHALMTKQGYRRVLAHISVFDDWYVRA
jgi:FkbM family methyltransferase